MKYKLKDCTLNITDGTHSTVMDDKMGEYFLLSCKNIKNGEIILGNNERRINKETLNKLRKRTNLQKGDVLITTVGTLGELAYIKQKNINYDFQRSVGILKPNTQIVKTEYLYYLLKNNIDKVINVARGAVQQCIFLSELKELEFEICSLEEQSKVIKILNNIDKKIELNNQINDNLLEIINSIYRNDFLELNEFNRADNIADITIGKTPPRSLSECFSTNENDVRWVSISDLGKCGTYINNTTERLTVDAVNKYNVKIVPKETVILSFKLTVGRVAITRQKMATNEAIAHFNLKNKEMKHFIYSYLKNFDFGSLGSTSSIATAVNSKIIKAMPIAIPNNEELIKYNKKVKPLFEKVKNNEIENEELIQLRDTLLPKLINREIDLDKIEIY